MTVSTRKVHTIEQQNREQFLSLLLLYLGIIIIISTLLLIFDFLYGCANFPQDNLKYYTVTQIQVKCLLNAKQEDYWIKRLKGYVS